MAQPKATAKQASFIESLAKKNGISDEMGKQIWRDAQSKANEDRNYWTEADWGEWRKMSRKEASALIDILLNAEW